MWRTIWYLVSSFALLIAAVVQAIQGDWNPAIFLALLWIGWTNNITGSVTTALMLKSR